MGPRERFSGLNVGGGRQESGRVIDEELLDEELKEAGFGGFKVPFKAREQVLPQDPGSR